MLEKIDHVGVAVKSVEEVKKLYKEVFNLEPVFEEIVEEQKVKAVGFKVGESKIEFLEPTADDSPITKFINKRGEGLHHIALSVHDIAEVLQNMKYQGLRLIDEEPKTGAEGKKIAFVHPNSVNGILLELSQEL
jgi:methylmalonyl-CoA epimerase